MPRKVTAPTKRGREVLKRLLSQRNQFPDRISRIDKQIRQTFERTVAVLVLDMVGFSRLTIEYGIIHYLAMINQMEQAARPAVTANRGKVIKQEADNLYCIFPNPMRALEGALDIFRAFDAVNTVVPPDRDIFGSIGIGYGKTLMIGNRDMFGSEMNLACKLGEDFAGKKQILLTTAARIAISSSRYKFTPVNFFARDLEIAAFRYEPAI
jgi:class 3 adenylate cyclase